MSRMLPGLNGLCQSGRRRGISHGDVAKKMRLSESRAVFAFGGRGFLPRAIHSQVCLLRGEAGGISHLSLSSSPPSTLLRLSTTFQGCQQQSSHKPPEGTESPLHWTAPWSPAGDLPGLAAGAARGLRSFRHLCVFLTDLILMLHLRGPRAVLQHSYHSAPCGFTRLKGCWVVCG